ncbi:hypothetical protein LRP49_06350 [Enterovibrio sp. ZSDZ35]|uniref:Uncharacterized protein n=1 Tax=Enterovibrio qingdaonensis TaxID=2899818 RepID=A0ABT5QIK8_9GAMM|nr:hypothetical protein [Enterovibrio sp. ZSDZ35]MDD1780819.1 hypothetical protein [Enterovibrio sp. ZSDZ35]
MFKKTLLAITLATAMSPAYAVDFDLNDLVPATADTAATVDTSATKEVDGVVIAEDPKAAVVAAHQSLIEEVGDGVKMIAVGSGIGILSTGTASYNNYDNPNASLLSKRGAYTRAFQVAKKQLVENFEGVQNACTTAASETIDAIDSGTESVANTTADLEQNCKESVSGALAGYVTFDVYDDPESKMVTVSLISTPKTREQTKRQVGALTQTTDPNSIFKHIIQDLSKGILPPVGAKVLTNPESGEAYVIGFGSSIIRKNKTPAVERKLKQASVKQSQSLARNALLSVMQGEKVYWEGGFDESQTEKNQQFDYHPETLDPSQVTVLEDNKHTFMNQFKMSDSYKSVASGQLPPGVNVKNFASADGNWMMAIAVYSPSLEKTASDAAKENEIRVREGQTQGNRHKISSDGLSDKDNAGRGPSGQVSNANDL